MNTATGVENVYYLAAFAGCIGRAFPMDADM